MNFIPVCEPCFIGNEARYTAQAVETAWVSSNGEFIKQFEEGFAEFVGVGHGVSCSSGTSALHLALLALEVGNGDEVIIPSFSMMAVLGAVLYVGAKPVFVDAEADTWNIDVSKIKEKITSKTKAIIAVHTYGHPVDMDPVLKLARSKEIYVVEDAAEAHAGEYKGRKCGSLADISCFSFYGNKIITTGEGGMVLTNDKKLAERCSYFKNLCFPMTGPRDYVHEDLGYNYRMTNVQAAIGLAQLEQIDSLSGARIKNAKYYNERLSEVPGITTPVEEDYAKNVYWMYGILINKEEFGISRDELMLRLKEQGIDSRYFFKPLHSQPLLESRGLLDEGEYPVTEHLARNGLYLPSSSKLTTKEIDRVCDTVKLIHKRV